MTLYLRKIDAIKGRPPIHLPKKQVLHSENYMAKSFVQNWVDFCGRTSLHGFKFVYDDNKFEGRSTFGKLWRILSFAVWISIVTICVVFAFYLMLLIWTRYQVMPTITTVETNNYPIWNIDFPAVTICNLNVIYAPHTVNITKILAAKGIDAPTIRNFYRSLLSLIKFRESVGKFLELFAILEENGYTTEKLMLELSQPCEKLIKACTWSGKLVDCSQIFRSTKSGEGFCCSFNYKAVFLFLEVNLTSSNRRQFDAPIMRVCGSGEEVGLRVLVDVEPEQYISSMKNFFGADILIHDPEDFPYTQLSNVVAMPQHEISVSIIPSLVVTEPSVRGLPISQRQCLFDDEKKLNISKKYSFQSCLTECRSMAIIEICNCLPYFFPLASANLRQCTLRDAKCLSDNRQIFNSLKADQDPHNPSNSTFEGMKCQCYPSCTEQNYEVQSYVAERIAAEKFGSSIFNNINQKNLSLVKIFFRDISCIKYRREIYMTWDAALASFGGIFGICLGGSVISFIEILYFCTIKLISRIFDSRREANKVRINRAVKELTEQAYRMHFIATNNEQKVAINKGEIYLKNNYW